MNAFFYPCFGVESTKSNLPLFQLLVFELENCKQPQVLFSLEPKMKGKFITKLKKKWTEQF